MADDARRSLPQIDSLVRAVFEGAHLPRRIVVGVVRDVVDRARRRARRGSDVPDAGTLEAEARAELASLRRRLLRPVINATGVVLHTNLGRAPLSDRAAEAVSAIARGYSNLEWDADTRKRGDRTSHVEPLLAELTGAQAALVVNNNAAAVLLVCAALAPKREVVISRGELIEIGGSFRIPDVLEQSGATLREVGTTNRTRASDYTKAIGKQTALVMVVHPSNYQVVGFTATPPLADVAAVARKAKVPLVFDAGSGLVGRELGDEPEVGAALRDGADLVCFSGDKLFGGPQAGIVVGKTKLIDALRAHPLMRALRPDKLQLAALAATTLDHLEGRDVPVWAAIDADLTQRATALADALRAEGHDATVIDGRSVVGGGSLPGHELPTPLVRVRPASGSASALAGKLATHDPPIVVTTERGAVHVDLRTVRPDDDALVASAF